MKNLQILVVDDERLARERLKKLLLGISGAKTIGEAADGIEALEKISTLKPNLVLLDIQMRGLSGFDVVEAIDQDHLPQIVFVTAYDEYALKAFEVSAVDYLLKPVAEERLRRALDRCRKRQVSNGVGDQVELLRSALTRGKHYLTRLIGKRGSRFCVVSMRDICSIQLESQLVYLVTGTNRYWTNYTLKMLEQRLDPVIFQRIHRRCIVNLSHVTELAPLTRGVYLVRLSNGVTVEASRQYAPVLKERLGWI